jgi:hypothetical protein
MHIDKDFLNRFGRVEAQYAVFSRKDFNIPDATPYQGFELWTEERNYFNDIGQYIPKTQ